MRTSSCERTEAPQPLLPVTVRKISNPDDIANLSFGSFATASQIAGAHKSLSARHVPNEEPPHHAGWLLKPGALGRKRFFYVLRGSKLYSATDRQSKGKVIFDVTGATAVRKLDGEAEFGFEIVTDNRKLVLHASSEEDRVAWGRALSEGFRAMNDLEMYQSRVEVLQKGERFIHANSESAALNGKGEPVLVVMASSRRALRLVGAKSSELRLSRIVSVQFGAAPGILLVEADPQSDSLVLLAATHDIADCWLGLLDGVLHYLQCTSGSEAFAASNIAPPPPLVASKRAESNAVAENEESNAKPQTVQSQVVKSTLQARPFSSGSRLALRNLRSVFSLAAGAAALRGKKRLTTEPERGHSIAEALPTRPASLRSKGLGAKVKGKHVTGLAAATAATPSMNSLRRCIAYAFGLALGVRYGPRDASLLPEEEKSFIYMGRTKFECLTHAGAAFDFHECAPGAFGALRRCFGISDASLAESLASLKGGGQGEGKSGQLFYQSTDGGFIIKTVKDDEVEFFVHGKKGGRSVLRHYCEHLLAHPDTLLCRFYGLFQIRFHPTSHSDAKATGAREGGECAVGTHQKKLKGGGRDGWLTLIVMPNVLRSDELKIDHTYDLKGSTNRRYVNDESIANGASVLKDLNFKEKIYLDKSDAEELMAVVKNDVALLVSLDIMDYSLLLGIHHHSRSAFSSGLSSLSMALDLAAGDSGAVEHALSTMSPNAAFATGNAGSAIGTLRSHDLLSGGEAKKGPQFRWQRDDGGIEGRTPTFDAVTYFIAIIDILQLYDRSKQLEHTYKSARAKIKDTNAEISAVSAKEYGERFVRYIDSIVVGVQGASIAKMLDRQKVGRRRKHRRRIAKASEALSALRSRADVAVGGMSVVKRPRHGRSRVRVLWIVDERLNVDESVDVPNPKGLSLIPRATVTTVDEQVNGVRGLENGDVGQASHCYLVAITAGTSGGRTFKLEFKDKNQRDSFAIGMRAHIADIVARAERSNERVK